MKLYSLALLALLTVPLSQQHGPSGPIQPPGQQDDRPQTDRTAPPKPRIEVPHPAPEIDPSSAGVALAMLTGGILMLRGRR